MASSNVEFYQRQKDLQDKVTKSEQERLQLEKQLGLLMRSDQNSAQMRAAKLHTYWKKICADEKRAQQRNAMLVREFERIDSHLNSMAARTERLNLLKKQYADYVARTYPQWTQMVEQKMRGETEQVPASQAARMSRESSAADDSTGAKMPMSRPVQSVSVKRVSVPDHKPAAPQQVGDPTSEYVNISSLSNQQPQPAHAGQGDEGPMDPGKDDDDVSDFGSDLPLSAGDASPVKVTVDRGPPSRQQFSQSRADSVRSVRSSSGSLLPELTVDGLIHLLRHIEADLRTRKPGVEYYYTPIMDAEEKLDIIQKANAGEALHGVSGQTASNLVLAQMSNVVRALPEGCLISEQVLTQPHSQLTSHDIERSLAGDAQDLWTVTFNHFQCLLDAKVMEAKEVAAVFVPCLVADRSQYQDKAFSLVVNLLEGDDADAATDASSIASPRQPASPTGLGGSGSLMEDGKVPPLKFGSLVDKPLSDDESMSFFDQSLPKEPAVPLNETSAYKQMLSGTLGTQQRAPVMSDDTDEDDVEKVLASSLTPKGPSSHGAAVPAATPREAATDPESLSELSSRGPKSPVYVPTAMEQRPMFGSGGASQAQRRP
ncbi:hypothetical protein BaRGS_00032504, partial [Batillaria attramentaria]